METHPRSVRLFLRFGRDAVEKQDISGANQAGEPKKAGDRAASVDRRPAHK